LKCDGIRNLLSSWWVIMSVAEERDSNEDERDFWGL
jgi:hypothetical protein